VKGRHILAGVAAFVALSGCHGSDDKKPEVTVPPASASAQNAYLEQLRAIDPKLTAEPKAAVAKDSPGDSGRALQQVARSWRNSATLAARSPIFILVKTGR
jgi:hypothetical protein